MTKMVLALVALAFGAVPVAAFAHHSAAQFDFSIRDTKWVGTVKEFKALNPHSKLVLEVSDETGVHDIQFEAHSLNSIYRNGWRPDFVHVGDKVTVITSPRKDGAAGGYALSIVTADGHKF
jgi:Family of unknown function (DUF6152)